MPKAVGPSHDIDVHPQTRVDRGRPTHVGAARLMHPPAGRGSGLAVRGRWAYRRGRAAGSMGFHIRRLLALHASPNSHAAASERLSGRGGGRPRADDRSPGRT